MDMGDAQDAELQRVLEDSAIDAARCSPTEALDNKAIDTFAQEILDVPPDFRTFLSSINPYLREEITYAAGFTLKLQFIQACVRMREEGHHSDEAKRRQQELWAILGDRDRRDLHAAHELSDGDHTELFLRIAEEDRRMRDKLK